MSLIKFNRNRLPWNNDLINFFDRDDFLDNDFFNLESSLPAMNVKENEGDFEIELASPGFDKKDFEITIEDDVLDVSAKKSGEEIDDDDDYTRKEFNYRSFRRTLQLPKTVDSSKDVKATYKDGILRLNLLKKEEAKRRSKRKIELA